MIMARTFTVTSYGKTKEYPESQRKKICFAVMAVRLNVTGIYMVTWLPVRRSVWTQNVH